jgi:hypothetical protein
MDMKLYGVWCKDLKKNKGDWMRELSSKVDDGEIAILAYTSKREAQSRAAKAYGYDTYSQVRKDDWCEVRPL